MSYDAGSIESRLTVDTDPFNEGLDDAKRKADELEGRDIVVNAAVDDAEADESLDHLDERTDELGDKDVTVDANADTSEADAKIDELDKKVDEASKKEIKIKAKVDTKESGGDSSDFLDKLGEKGKEIGMTVAKMGLLGTVGAGLLDSLLGPAVGLTGAFATAGVALGGFGLLAKSDFTQMQTDTKAVTAAQLALTTATTNKERLAATEQLAAAEKKIKGPEAGAIRGYADLNKVLGTLKQQTARGIFSDMVSGMNVAETALSQFAPVVNATSGAIRKSLGSIETAISGPGFSNFLGYVKDQIGPVLQSLTGTALNFGGGFAKMFENSIPVMHATLGIVQDLAKGFNGLTGSPGFESFMSFLAKTTQQLVPLFRTLFDTLGHILVGVEPLVHPLLNFLQELIGAIDKIATGGGLTALVDVVIALGGALKPILPVLATLINTLLATLAPVLEAILPPLGQLIAAIGSGLAQLLPPLEPLLMAVANQFVAVLHAVEPLIGPLVSMLVPVIRVLVDILVPLLKFLLPLTPIFLALTNPVLAVVAAFVMWRKPIMDVIDWLGKLAEIIGGALGTAVSWLADIGGDIISGLWTGIKDGWTAVYSWFKDMNKTVTGWLADAGRWLVSIGVKVVTGLWNGLKSEWSMVSGWFHSLNSVVNGWLSDAGHWLVSIGEKIITGLWNGIKAEWNFVERWYKTLGSMVKGWLSGAGSWLLGIGESIVMGLWNGMKEVWNELYSWVKSLGSKIKSGISDALKVFSPSRVMHELGVYIMQGLRNGMNEGFVPIEGDLTANANKIKAAFGDVGSSVQLTVGATANSQLAAVNAQATSIAALSDQLSGLRDDVRKLPSATGNAVGQSVSGKFKEATTLASQQALTTSRRGS